MTEIAVTVVLPHGAKDVQLRVGADSAGQAIYEALAPAVGQQPESFDLLIERTGATVVRDAPATAAALRWGDRLLAVARAPRANPPATYCLVGVKGPLVGCHRPLPQGRTELGRQGWPDGLSDPAMSRHHAVIDVQGSAARVTDVGSTNGTLVDGVVIGAPTNITAGSRVLLGDTEFLVMPTGPTDGRAHLAYADGRLGFGRSVDVLPPAPAVTITLPTPPTQPPKRKFPLGTALIPLVMGAVMWKVTGSTMFLVFMALSPAMLVYSTIDDRRSGRRQFKEESAKFETALAQQRAQVDAAAAAAASWRHLSQPSSTDLLAAAVAHDPSVWSRHPRRADFLHCRIGTADLPSLVTVEAPRNGAEDLRAEADEVAAAHRLDRGVPVVLPLGDLGSVGLHGPPAEVAGAARSLVATLTTLHSPRYLSLVVIAPESGERWSWTKWLPHVSSLIDGTRTVAADQEEAAQLWKALEEVVERRRAETEGRVLGARPVFTPHVLVVLEPPLDVTARELSRFLEGLHEVGMSVVWVGTDRDLVPSECRALLDADGATGSLTFVDAGTTIGPVAVDRLAPSEVAALGRAMAPLADTTAEGSGGQVPAAVSLLDLLGAPDLTAETVLRWWARPRPGLGAEIGADGTGPITLDLRRDGPHGLVAGSTGAGKSEFLQTLVASLALHHRPQDITFILVDYKGGAAFKDCVAFPHTVGFVTDLDTRRTMRARTSLNAELKRREALLAMADAKDLADMLAKDPEHAPPSLLIVVDEYAALKDEVPDFVDTVVDVARRGRSLGVHLILATQTPEGVISKDIERNSDLRVALRLQNASESDQLIGSRAAVDIPKRYPGRALLRSGSSGLKPFQSAYVGGLSLGGGPDPTAVAQTFRFGAAERAMARQIAAEGAGSLTDLKRIALVLVEAFQRSGSPPPFRPWPEELPPVIPLDALLVDAPRTGLAVPVGVADRLERQTQEPFLVDFGTHSSFAVYGSPGSGATTFLRTLAIALASTRGTADVHLYGIDCGGGGLRCIEALPHCGAVVAVDDTDRLRSLLAMLADEASQRSALLAQSGAGSLDEHRRRTGSAPPPIVVLVDRFAAFWNVVEPLDRSEHAATFVRLVTEGRGIGIHVVLTADRRAALPPNLHSAIGARVVLRMSSVDEYGQLELAQVKGSEGLPPGRGFVTGAREVQVAVVCPSPSDVDGPAQAGEIERRGAAMAVNAGDSAVLPSTVGVLPDDIALSSVTGPYGPGVLLGLGGLGNQPVTVDLDANPVFMVAGPEGSGRSQALATIVRGLVVGGHVSQRSLVAGRRTPLLRGVDGWDEEAIGAEAATATLARLAADVAAVPTDDDHDGPSGPRRLIVVDDADEMIEGAVATSLGTLLRRARDADCIVLVSLLSFRAARGYSEWVNYCKTNRHGLLLQPDAATDGDAFRIDLPKRANLALPVGRGYLVQRTGLTLVQVAR